MAQLAGRMSAQCARGSGFDPEDELRRVVHTYNPTTWEVETEDWNFMILLLQV